MRWITLPHQINNRKFTQAVVFVHGQNGSAASWKGAPDRFVDRLSQIRPIYNHFGLYVIQYDTKIFELGPAWKLLAAIPGYSEKAQDKNFNAAIKKLETDLRACLSEFLAGYKTIVFVGHEIGGLVIKRIIAQIHEPPKCLQIDVDDPNSDADFNKLSTLLNPGEELSGA